MSDFLLKLNRNPAAKKLASNLGVPVPTPLRRASGPWREDELKGLTILLGGSGELTGTIAQAIEGAGAQGVLADPGMKVPYAEAVIKSNARVLGEGETLRLNGLIYDASTLEGPEDLVGLQQFFTEHLGNLAKNARIIVLGRPSLEVADLSASVAAQALEGFVRSLSKEVGRRGATAQLVTVVDKRRAALRTPAVLRFLLSERSAFVTGQVLAVSSTVAAHDNPPCVQGLKDKIALVTGAARGIGAATARSLALEGAHVVCLDRPEDEGLLQPLVAEISGEALLLDITARQAPGRIHDFLLEKYGRVDVVVHNAGITRDKTLGKMTPEFWNQVIDVNLSAVVEVTESLLEDGLGANGRIICLSSISGIAGNFGQTNYGASKAGVIGLVRYLSRRVGRRGITVNAVAPGFIETRLTESIPFMTREVGRRLNALSQGGVPQDIAEVIAFLAGGCSSGLTGQVIRVCGGNLLGA